MIIGIGTDIVYKNRIEYLTNKFGNKFISRILSQNEILQLKTKTHNYSFIAKRFAAKEAVAKAFGLGIGKELSFQDIEISNNEFGMPIVTIKRPIAHGKNIFLSISDEHDVAIAFAVISI